MSGLNIKVKIDDFIGGFQLINLAFISWQEFIVSKKNDKFFEFKRSYCFFTINVSYTLINASLRDKSKNNV